VTLLNSFIIQRVWPVFVRYLIHSMEGVNTVPIVSSGIENVFIPVVLFSSDCSGVLYRV
jgi:hypothetical protein